MSQHVQKILALAASTPSGSRKLRKTLTQAYRLRERMVADYQRRKGEIDRFIHDLEAALGEMQA